MTGAISSEILDKYEGEAISAEKEINEKVSKALKNPYASRRWFWELLQNAVDTISDESERKVNVKIELKQSDLGPVLIFIHDGNPFRKSKKKYRFDDFKNLINPTSGKAQEDDTTIGKFGTGFLSTHVLSLRIDVRGIFEVSDSEKIPLSTTLDRTGFILETEDARAKRIESLVISLDEYEKSKSIHGSVDGYPNAEFTYYLNINNLGEGQSTMHYVQEGLTEIEHSLPLVFAFNKKIESIQIVDTLSGKSIITRYKNQEKKEKIGQKIDVHITEKIVDEEKPINFYVGVLKNDEAEVAWRLKETKNSKYSYEALDNRALYSEDLGQEMAGLYSTFPLVGSHSFKFPLVINSNKFKPNETRDGISLIKTEDYNKLLIDQAAILYKEYLSVASANIGSIYNICDTKHQLSADHLWIEKEWYDKKVDEIRAVIATVPIISVTNVKDRVAIQSNEKIQQIWFPKLKLEGSVENEWNNSFYDFYFQFFADRIPIKEEVNSWLSILWESSEIPQVSIKDLIDEIQNFSGLAEFSNYFKTNCEETEVNIDEELSAKAEEEAKNWLIDFYNFILSRLNRSDLLDYSKTTPPKGIILSRSKKFKLLKELKNDVGFDNQQIDSDLIDIHSKFYPSLTDYADKLIHSNLVKLIELIEEDITEEAVAKEIKEKAEDEIKEHDSLLKRLTDNTVTNDSDKQRKIAIEERLSTLQNWIAVKNENRNYFDNYFKRKVLQAIIDEKKSSFLTQLLEYDRSDKISLERQTEILSDPDLDDKLQLGNDLLEYQKDKEERDKRNRERGAHFEKLLKELLDNHGIPNIQRDGEQDFILYGGTDKEKYIELKSISISQDVISLTPEQAKKAVDKGLNYFLCVIPNSGDYSSFSTIDFERNARFTNELKVPLGKNIAHAKGFELLNEGVKGEYPSPLLANFRIKPYYINVFKEAWGATSFVEFLQMIK